jgi:hypothetical protein
MECCASLSSLCTENQFYLIRYGPFPINGNCQTQPGRYGIKEPFVSRGGIHVFNHAQFFGPQAVDGNIGDTTFGQVINAAPPRILQGALKFSF